MQKARNQRLAKLWRQVATDLEGISPDDIDFFASVIGYVSDKTIVLSDVDGTIVNGSLLLNHACFLHDEGVFDFKDLSSLWRSDEKNEDLITRLAEGYREQMVGKTLEELKFERFLSQSFSLLGSVFMVNKAGSRLVYSSALLLQFLAAGGARVFFISGSPEYLVAGLAATLDDYARRLADLVDIDEPENRCGFYGSVYERDDAGRLTGNIDGMFSAKAKTKVVGHLVETLEHNTVIALGDTASDMPLLARANHAILVAPHDKTAQVFKASAIMARILQG